jgi:hypothetical protein
MDMFQHLFEPQLQKEMDILGSVGDDEISDILSRYVEAINSVQELIRMGFRILEEAKRRSEGLRMIRRHLIEVHEALEHHGRESLEAAGSLWNTIMECWFRRNGPPLTEGSESAFNILQRWFRSIERGLGIQGSELARESVTTLETLIEQAKSAPPSDPSVPPDYIIYECHRNDAGIRDADIAEFKALLSRSVGIDPASIVSMEICAGSLIVKALFHYQVTFNKVTKFSGSGNQQWNVDVVYEIKQTPEISELVEEVKQNAQWLSIPDPNRKVDFLLSDPNVTPVNLITTTLVDFAAVDQFVTDSIEKSCLDLEVSAISFYGNSSFYHEFEKTLKQGSKLKYLFHGASQPDGFIGDGFDLKRLGASVFGTGTVVIRRLASITHCAININDIDSQTRTSWDTLLHRSAALEESSKCYCLSAILGTAERSTSYVGIRTCRVMLTVISCAFNGESLWEQFQCPRYRFTMNMCSKTNMPSLHNSL